MHIYLYISAALFFIVIPMLFALLLRAIYGQQVRHIYIFGTLSVLTFIVSFAFFAKDFVEVFRNEKCQSNIHRYRL